MKFSLTLAAALMCCSPVYAGHGSHGSTSYETVTVTHHHVESHGSSHGRMGLFARMRANRQARQARRAAAKSHGHHHHVTSYGSHGSVSYAAPAACATCEGGWEAAPEAPASE